MSQGNFEACAAFTLEAEGGYDADPADRGNWINGVLVGSNLGITAADVRQMYGWRFATTPDFMRSITPDFARRALRALYWNPVNGEALWPGLDLLVFDFGFNAGIGSSVEELQRLLRVDQDGDLGPLTLAAANAVDDRVQ